MNLYNNLSEKILSKKAVIGIIGVGYVGDALANGAFDIGYEVIGFTRDKNKAHLLNKKQNIKYRVTADNKKISKCDVIAICVPTPIKHDKSPDLEPLISSLHKVKKYMTPGTLVIIESTISAGTTRDIALPILKKSKLKEEDEFFLAFSPERVDPGNLNYGITNTPKVVAGLSDASKTLASIFYSAFVENVVPVSSLEAAEMSKLIENSYRFINISFMNEMLTYANNIGVDLWEVIDAAATKPFGFMPHYPGPGIGGHCIPVDPYYLMDDARKRNINLNMLELAGSINDNQPKKVVQKTLDILNKTNGTKKSHSALIIGISYKEDTPDDRESPSLIIWNMLKKENISVEYHDPYIPKYNGNTSIDLSNSNSLDEDIIILTTPHSTINYDKIISFNIPIIDTKNALKKYSNPHIYRL